MGRFEADQGQRMPDTIRAAGTGNLCDGRKCLALPMAVLTALPTVVAPARAQDGDPLVLGLAYVQAIRKFDAHELAGITLFFGVLIFAVVTAIMLVRTHERLRAERARTCAQVAALDGEIDRLYGLLLAEPQVVVAWSRGAVPEIIGDPRMIAPELTADRIMTFAAWLRPEQALLLDSAVERLLTRGEGFSIPLTTAAGRHVAAEGRAIGGSAILRLNEVRVSRRKLQSLPISCSGNRPMRRRNVLSLKRQNWKRCGLTLPPRSKRIAVPSTIYRRESPYSVQITIWPSTIPPIVNCGKSMPDSSTAARPIPP